MQLPRYMHRDFVECTSDNSFSCRQKAPMKDRIGLGMRKGNLAKDATLDLHDLLLEGLVGI